MRVEELGNRSRGRTQTRHVAQSHVDAAGIDGKPLGIGLHQWRLHGPLESLALEGDVPHALTLLLGESLELEGVVEAP